MLDSTIQLIMFIVIALGVIAIFYFYDGITKINILIFLTLFLLWFIMYFYKDIPEYQKNIAKLGIWVWPIILSIYQFTQAIVRLPIGMLSQKLNSRKKIVQFAGLILLVAITLLIASRMAVWAIVLAAFASGVFGATFGLDAQYVSENWDIKQVFRSSVMVFIIPVMAKMLSKSIVGYSELSNFGDVWIYLLIAAMVVGTTTIVLYSFSKEDVSSIRIDNMDNSKVSVSKRGPMDIFVLSLSGALLLFMYTFVIGLGEYFNIGIWGSVIEMISLFSSVVVGLFIIKKVSAIWLKKISMFIMINSFLVIGITGVTNTLNETLWISMASLASIGLGSYLMVLFGATLHFDHKYPALVIGIFLSVKSFMTAIATVSTGEIMTMKLNDTEWIGIITFIVTISSFILMEISHVYFFKRKDNKIRTIDKLIDDMVKYEKENSSKIVISNK